MALLDDIGTVYRGQPAGESSQLGKKRTVLLLRTVVVISTGYLILFGQQADNPWALAYIAALLASNLALSMTPEEWFHSPRFSGALLLSDTAAVLVGLYLTVGCFSQDFLIIYFFTIFLTTATQSIGQIALGAAIVSCLYGYWLSLTAGHPLTAGEWLRLPFFFIVAVFYAYTTEETKVERWRREQAERERERLRFLLNMAEPLSNDIVGREWVTQVCSAVESAFPRLLCNLSASPPPGGGGRFSWFPVRGREAMFGGLVVTARDDVALSPSEEQFCRVVSFVAGHALGEAKIANADSNTRLRQEFLGMLSHELRTPLHAILGYAEMLSIFLDESGDLRPRDVLDRLQANAARLQDLLGEMLWLAELRSGERGIVVEDVNVAEVVEEEGRIALAQLVGRPVTFEATIANDLPMLKSDRRKLGQIVRSLVSNAVKFTDEGSIRVSAKLADSDEVELIVLDTGVGIAEHHFKTIFEDFRQLDGSLTRRAGGIGLGLSLARELVASIGGRIEIESQPGIGTAFHVFVPLRPNAVGGEEAEPEAYFPELEPALAIAR